MCAKYAALLSFQGRNRLIQYIASTYESSEAVSIVVVMVVMYALRSIVSLSVEERESEKCWMCLRSILRFDPRVAREDVSLFFPDTRFRASVLGARAYYPLDLASKF